jgi:hypothetical protein
MDARLSTLIRDYLARVAEAVAMLEAVGIPRPVSAADWAASDIPPRGSLPDGRYEKHDAGCIVQASTWSVDFAFGVR